MQHSATRRWTNRITALLLLMLTAMPFTQTKASHFVGVDMTSECLNACTVRVHLRAYRDCTGASSISNTITFTSTTPGCVAPTALTSWSPQVTTEVTPICPSTQTQCTNAAATINGVQEYYWFRDYDICASPNCDYDISWGSCCRNGIITSGAGNQGFAINTYVNYTLGCNNSPVFTDVPLFYACANQQYVIHQGAFDPDGDSLAFSIQNCYTNVSNNSVTYNAGYSPTTPLGPSWDVQVNPQNGMMTLTPMPGNVVVGVICFNVDEYRNGVLMGTTVRDMQVVVVPCAANVIPDYTAYSNLSAGASIIGQDSFLVCPNNQICFDLTGFDPDTLTGQSLTMAWSQNIPGATFVDQNNAANQDTITGNSPDGRFCWTPTTAGVYQFLINLDDNACPIFGQHDKVVTIVVGGNTPAALITATGTLNSCNGENDTLCVAPGWTSYLWSTAATTSCINVSTPGVYGVTVTGPGGCGLMDQVTVVDNPVPQISGFAYDHLAAPLASQKIYLIDHDTSNHSLAAVDSTVTDSAGYFEFCTVSIDTAYVKAAPDSALYPMDMPTYSDTAIVWNNALAFPASGFPTSVVINCQFGSNPGGLGFIGGLISAGANKTNGPGDPVPNQRVILYSNTLGHAIGYTDTDINGYFSFGNIPYGDYSVIADKPMVDHINVPTVAIDAQTPMLDSLDFRLHTTYLELVLGTAVSPEAAGTTSFELYPNPIRNTSRLEVQLDKAGTVRLAVLDIHGKQVRSLMNGHAEAGAYTYDVDANKLDLADGVYFLRMEMDGFSKTKKILILKD